MQPRSLAQVLTELDGVYSPQVDSIRQRQAAIPGQVEAEEQGLQAKQTTAFGDILNGARRRGTGVAFGGIPLQEQARYTADNYLPAVARLRQSAREQAMSLEDSILGINERKYSMGQNIYSQEQQMAEQRRQFDAQLAESRRQAAASAASSFNPIGAGSSPTSNNPAENPDPLHQVAYNDIKTRMSRDDDKSLVSDYRATFISAGKGNAKDKIKVQMYQQLRPDLFNMLSKNYMAGMNKAATPAKPASQPFKVVSTASPFGQMSSGFKF